MSGDAESVESDVLDRLRRATAANPGELVDLYQEYVNQARHTLVGLRDAVKRQQSEEVRNHAHYLKGSSLIMGARVVARHCSVLEEVREDGNFHAAAELVQQIGGAIDDVEICLTRRIGLGVSPAANRKF